MSAEKLALEVAVKPEPPMSPEQMKDQVDRVLAVMDKVMVEGIHYGTIPGAKKKKRCLFKPGAEKLGMTFHLDPQITSKREDLDNGHREYEVTCRLVHLWSGRSWEGIGLCTTMESKYRYRGSEKTFTDNAVPKEYWNARDSDNPARAQELLGGAGFIAGKNDDDGRWYICVKGERLPNPELADSYNTVLKMAKKRAHVDAILTATACSDIFTQDVVDEPEKKKDGEAKREEPPKERPATVRRRGRSGNNFYPPKDGPPEGRFQD